MRVIIATLNKNMADIFCASLKENFKISNIEIIENYEILLENLIKNEIDIFIVDNQLKVNNITSEILTIFTKKFKSIIKNKASNFIFLSNDKKVFEGLGHFNDNVIMNHWGKSLNHNSSKIKILVKNLFNNDKKLRKFLKKKLKIYFIHGFSGNQNTWVKFVALIKEDTDCKELFEIDYYNYPTFSFLGFFKNLNKNKYDSLFDNAKSLQTKIETDNPDKFILVGHSLGGLIIREFLLNFYLKYYKNKLEKVLLFAPAHNGSKRANLLKIIFRKNIHLKILANDNWYLSDLNSRWNNSEIENKLYIKALIGLRDKTAKKSSANYGLKQSNISYYNDMDHTDIKEPGTNESDIFKNFKRHMMKS